VQIRGNVKTEQVGDLTLLTPDARKPSVAR
jgi:hypothetical protein